MFMRTRLQFPFSLISLCCALQVLTLCGLAADLEPFLHPAASVWGLLLEPDAHGASVASVPGGFVVTGTKTGPVGPDLDNWGIAARILSNGTVMLTTNLHYKLKHNTLNRVAPVYGAAGALDGFLLLGGLNHFVTDPGDPAKHWDVPWFWALRTDASFLEQWEWLYGVIGDTSQATATLVEPGGFLIGGWDCYAAGNFRPSEWLLQLNAAGTLMGQTNFGYNDISGVNSVIPAAGGGYVLATGRGVVKVNSAFEVQWRAGHEPAEQSLPDAYNAVAQLADGSLLAVGTRTSSTQLLFGDTQLLLSRFAADGRVLWTRVYGTPGQVTDTGNDLLLTSDGGCVLVGTTASFGHGGTDAWLVKADTDGLIQWDVALGGPGDDTGRALALGEDGNYVLAGTASVEGVPTMWLLKMTNYLRVPLPAFSFSPPSPVFRDQVVSFDARASSVPGSTIASYLWDFGDGQTGTGATIDHTFKQAECTTYGSP
jgi:hypothetical protein